MDARQTSIFAAILIASIVVAVVIAYLIAALIRHSRKNIALYKSKLVAEITTLENERKRMASDLHDELGPLVAAIKLKLDSLEVADKEDEKTRDNIHDNLSEIIFRMKNISDDLMPVILVKKGLIEAIEADTCEINRCGLLHIKLTHVGIPTLEESVAINLYRIIQEIIHNTIKHAGATELKIDMKMKKETLLVSTQDNGKGFNFQKGMKEHTGMGLGNLLSRAEVLGGAMYLDSSGGKGTAYTFEIPLQTKRI